MLSPTHRTLEAYDAKLLLDQLIKNHVPRTGIPTRQPETIPELNIKSHKV